MTPLHKRGVLTPEEIVAKEEKRRRRERSENFVMSLIFGGLLFVFVCGGAIGLLLIGWRALFSQSP